MATIMYTRGARCADCVNFKYYYAGKRKLHVCVVMKQPRTLKDLFAARCEHFTFRKDYYPEKA